MNIALLLGSLVAVLLLAATAHWLGLGGDARLDEGEARHLAEAQGVRVLDMALDRAGMAALVRGTDERLLLIRRHGAHFVAQPLRRQEARLDHQFLSIGRVTLDLGGQAAEWAASVRRAA